MRSDMDSYRENLVFSGIGNPLVGLGIIFVKIGSFCPGDECGKVDLNLCSFTLPASLRD
jgi:hypothetical protein